MTRSKTRTSQMLNSEAKEVTNGQIGGYEVTELAPGRVAGTHVSAGDFITLTEDQARSELLSGHIRPAPENGSTAD